MPPTGVAPAPRRVSRRYSAGDKLALIRAYEASNQEMRVFCAGHGLSTAGLCKWRRQYAAQGDAGLAARRPPPRRPGPRGSSLHAGGASGGGGGL
ncbi:MAG: hypothetical protein DRQ55_09150 [Planctomycetota bacterium]|nr:MAG: hypothetical protein DRQ55_09150 [Planctomycetota bacterium]